MLKIKLINQRFHRETLPLDTSNVNSYLEAIRSLSLSEYVSYNAAEEELADCGLDNPDLTVTMTYTIPDEEEDGNEEENKEKETGTFTLHISRDPEEKAEEEKKENASETSEKSDEEEEITAYARVGDSQIIYKITGDEYEALMAASYDDLRHQDVLWASFSDVYQVDISLEGKDYTFTSKEEDEETLWYYQEEEVDIDDFRTALYSLTASEFTDEQPGEKEEISLKVYIDNENEPEKEISLYRYDGSRCLAVVDGEPVSLIDRSRVVDLIEAVNAVILN